MWQRIQTLYLLIASGLLVAMYFQPYGTGFIILFSLALACQLLAIVALKSRVLQMRLSGLAALLLLGLQAWMIVSYLTADPRPSLTMTSVFPVVAAILDFLAAKAILKDELLVRSASRLRASKRK
ncbi:MAG: DUF4293 family protein [Bacteroidales bacterium]|nr:DUF4293 family protein [Bacteroidales bacterium]